MERWLFLFVIIFCDLQLLAQTNNKFVMKGRIYDSQSKEILIGATVNCLFGVDSSIVAVTFTDKNGEFSLDSLTEGGYYLYITYIGYNSMLLYIPIKPGRRVIDIESIVMHKSDVILAGVSVIGVKSPARVVKDTVEFNSSYYKMREHSMLEDLLRRLPGVQVEQDGTIRMNGEIVKTILIDGRPFFINDPKMVSKNLQLDMIDKVQLIDRRVKERDIFSLDEGQKEKAINIIIRADKRNAWDGELMAGYAVGDRFAVRANIARFKDDEQIAIFANGDNVNGYLDGSGGGGGVLTKLAPNFSYSKSFGDKVNFSVNYVMQDLSLEESRTSSQRNYINDTSYYYNQRLTQLNNTVSHGLSTQMNVKIDSTWTLNLTSVFGYSNTKDGVTNDHGSYGDKYQMLDSGWLDNSTLKNAYNFSNTVSIVKRLKNDGHGLSMMLSYTNNVSRESNYIFSNIFFPNDRGEYDLDTLNQLGSSSNRPKTFQFVITHAITILSKVSLVTSYGLVRSNNSYDLITMDFNYGDGKYDRLADSLSARFKSLFTNSILRIGVNSNIKNLEYSVFLSASKVDFKTHYFAIKDDTRLSTLILLPTGYLSYNFTNSKRLRISFNENSVLPTLQQMKPVPDISNPLVIKYGNPNLKVGKMSTLSLSYNSFNNISMRYFSVTANSSFFRNQIVSSMSLDSFKRQVIQPLNISGSYGIGLNIENSFPIRNQKSAINTNTSFDFKKSISFVNDFKGYGKNLSISQSLSYNYSYRELLNILIGTGINYYRVYYSDQAYNISNYFSYSFLIDCNAKLPLGISAGVNFSYSLNTGRGDGFNSSVPMLNASISKKLFSDHRGEFKLRSFDILNNNLSVNRSIGSNYIEDVKTNVLHRFFMLSFSYYIKGNRATDN